MTIRLKSRQGKGRVIISRWSGGHFWCVMETINRHDLDHCSVLAAYDGGAEIRLYDNGAIVKDVGIMGWEIVDGR